MKIEIEVDLPWVARRSTTKRQMAKKPIKFASFAMVIVFFSYYSGLIFRM